MVNHGPAQLLDIISRGLQGLPLAGCYQGPWSSTCDNSCDARAGLACEPQLVDLVPCHCKPACKPSGYKMQQKDMRCLDANTLAGNKSGYISHAVRVASRVPALVNLASGQGEDTRMEVKLPSSKYTRILYKVPK